jgi:hypothetical protein
MKTTSRRRVGIKKQQLQKPKNKKKIWLTKNHQKVTVRAEGKLSITQYQEEASDYEKLI